MKSIKLQLGAGAIDAFMIAVYQVLIGLCLLNYGYFFIGAIVVTCSFLSVSNGVNRYRLYKSL